MAIYKRSRGFELGTTEHKSSKWPERDSNPGPPDCESDALTTRPRCLPTTASLQLRRRRKRKRHVKNEFALFQSSSLLFHLSQFVKCWRIFLELNSKGLHLSSQKEKIVVFCPRSPCTKREIKKFHVAVVQRRQRKVQTRMLHVQSCCFAHQNRIFFAALVAVADVVV